MKTHAWQRTIGAWLFFPILYFVLNTNASLLWYALSFIVYIFIALTVTVGYHRLFTHNAFVCSKFWHWTFGLIGTISLNSSPVHWSTVHSSHHKFSDTHDDPYDSNWKHFFRFKDRSSVKATKNELRMMRDPMHKFFMDYSLLLSISFGLFLYVLNTNLFLFLYALPTTAYLVTSGLHTIFAHDEHGAKNLWLMEFIIPMAGEWIHREHHDRPGDSKFNSKPEHFDLGGNLIGLIQNVKRPS